MIRGVRVGHWTNEEARTGCTVVLLPEGNVTSGEVRGGAPGTREFALLEPARYVGQVDAVVMTGGSAFGLAACDGVVRWLEERERGYPTAAGPVPIVVGMVLFDLRTGDGSVRPGPENGYTACEDARDEFATGSVGAGTGLTFAKWLGREHARPGGIGVAVERHGAVEVGALVALNAVGDVLAPGGSPRPAPPDTPPSAAFTNTTVGVLVTNAKLDKLGCYLVSQSAHDGLARALEPAHTLSDGDAFVVSSIGAETARLETVRLLAARAVEAAIRAVAAA